MKLNAFFFSCTRVTKFHSLLKISFPIHLLLAAPRAQATSLTSSFCGFTYVSGVYMKCNFVLRNIQCGLENRLTTVGDPPRSPRDTPLSAEVDTKFRRQVTVAQSV
jgi:hypothetical protein